jgi:hypothetical protein
MGTKVHEEFPVLDAFLARWAKTIPSSKARSRPQRLWCMVGSDRWESKSISHQGQEGARRIAGFRHAFLARQAKTIPSEKSAIVTMPVVWTTASAVGARKTLLTCTPDHSREVRLSRALATREQDMGNRQRFHGKPVAT